MPDAFSSPVLLELKAAGALTAAVVADSRTVVPFDFQVVGVTASVATAPTGANLIFDVLFGANNTAPGSLTSLWSVNNGTSGNPDNRPTILAGNYDQKAIAGSTTTTQSKGIPSIPITVTNYVELPFVAKPDPNTATGQLFEGNQPANESEVNPIVINATEPGTPNWPVAAGAGSQNAFVAAAGSVLQLKVAQIGSTVAGSDASVLVWLVRT